MNNLALYGPDFSYYLRAMRILMQFKGLSYSVTNAPFAQKITYFSDEHEHLHPFRKLPVLIHGDYVLPETMAIAHYINAFDGPNFLLDTPRSQASAIAMASHVSNDVHMHLIKNVVLEFAFPKGPDNSIRLDKIKENLVHAHHCLEWISKTLVEGNPDAGSTPDMFIFGQQFTLADAYLIPMLDYLDQLPEPFNLTAKHEIILKYLAFHRAQAYCEGILGAPNI